MLEFKGITFEKMYPDPSETWFCGLSFERHINNVSFWCGLSFEQKLIGNQGNAIFMFGGV